MTLPLHSLSPAAYSANRAVWCDSLPSVLTVRLPPAGLRHEGPLILTTVSIFSIHRSTIFAPDEGPADKGTKLQASMIVRTNNRLPRIQKPAGCLVAYSTASPMSTSTPGPRCTCRYQFAHPQPTNARRLLSVATAVLPPTKKFVDGAKSMVELGKTVILPAIGFRARSVPKGMPLPAALGCYLTALADSLAARIQATVHHARTRGVISALQSLRAKPPPPPPPSPVRLLASAIFLPYGAWQLYKILASDGDPNPELWQRRVECSCDRCECDERCGCACRRRAHCVSRRLLTFMTSSTFVDCCCAAAFLVVGIASAQLFDVAITLWSVRRIKKSIGKNFIW